MSEATIVAKMYLVSRTENLNPEGVSQGEQVKLAAVYGNGEANKQWSKFTPSGVLELNITNPEACGVLKGGYYKVLLVPCGAED